MDTRPDREKRDATEAFLDELTALSRKHRVGITGKPVLFIMEWEDDSSSYSIDSESNLRFG
jgi:hypothetical protein